MDRERYDRLLDGLKRLKLRRTRQTLEETSQLAIEQRLSYLEYLATLVEEELATRQATQLQKRLQKARFPAIKRLEDFDFTFQTSANPQAIMDLARLGFVSRHENLVFLGPPGVGKSHLAIALGLKALEGGYRVLFTTAQELVDNLYASLADGTLRNRLKAYLAQDVLIVDEFAYLPMDVTASNHFYQVVAQAYERRSLILTSNRPFQDWGQAFASPAIASATLDRLLHHAHVFSLKGQSYRLKREPQGELLMVT